jgi:tetratricopeptide (TPR) repeat protein
MASKVSVQELEQVESEWVSNPSPILCARFADLLRQSGRFDEAFKIAEEGLKQWQNNSSISVVLGKCYLDAGLLEKSQETFEKVRSTQPQNLVVLRSLAEIHFRREEWDKSISLFEEYLFENPGDEEAREMQEKARSGKGTSIEDLFSEETSGDGDLSAMGEAGDDDHIFPDTDRMKKVLESQGYGSGAPADPPNAGQDEPADDTGGKTGYPMENDPVYDRSAPASLLEFFTDSEKEELKLETYDGED